MPIPNDSNQAALNGLTVLDLAGPLGNYCGKLFADMGADVILIEPLVGAPTRRSGPYVAGRQGQPDASLTFQYQNTSKRSIALDLDSAAGQAVFRKLAGMSHLVLESEQPGIMRGRGIDHKSLAREHANLVMASITAFGQDGPCAHWQATDLTAMAMGGMLYLAGYPDTAPMVACGEQAVGAANLFAAVASMAALHDAENGGGGQHIDVSMQECVVLGMENAVQFYDLEGIVRKRNAGTQRLAGTGAFACADGYVYMMAGGIGSNRFWSVTTEWLIGEGVPGADQFREDRWTDQAFLATDEAKSIFGRVFIPYVRTQTKAQLEEMGRRHRIPIAPICDASDIAGNVQREYRNYFVDVTSVDGTRLRMPGAPYLLSATPWRLYRRAPGLGEHSREVLSRAGISAAEQEQLFADGVVQ